jgi:DNA ligase-1
MLRFTQLFTELDQTNKTAEKAAAIERYFRGAPEADAAWALFFLSGLRFTRVLKTSTLQAAAIAATGTPAWLLEECYLATGDLSEAIALLLPGGEGPGLDEPLHRTVEGRIRPLVTATEDEARAMLTEAWALMNRPQRLVFNKLVRGNFRIGVQRRLVVRALAAATGVDPAVLEHRATGTFQPTPAAYLALTAPGETPDDAARPYPFCLAHQLDRPPEDLGDVSGWAAEFKWDGIRAQVVRRAHAGDEGAPALLWSRGEELVSGQFPEIVAAARRLPAGTVLDGEIMAWRFDPAGRELAGRPLSFNALQTRLNRKSVQPSLFDAEGVVFLAFDLLELGGVDQRARPLRERRAALESLMEGVQRATGGVLRLPLPAPAVASWADVARVRDRARTDFGAEGLMLKHLGSPYHVGRVAGGLAGTDPVDAGWWKWKVDPFAVDAVLVYAQHGTGKRAGLFTDYTFAVWDPAPPPAPGAELVPFAKAYSGLDNEEIRRVDKFVRDHTVDRIGPIRVVRPELVFEIAFEGLQASTRHRSGVAVRFPRIARWRTDKGVNEADTLAGVRALLEAERARDAGLGAAKDGTA